jgi:uncharacterized membrane protein
MVKVKEPPEELQRQKEDIENLLSSLETGFAEGSITQEHYNEVKQKNIEKLEEIKKKLKVVEKKVHKDSEKPALEKEPQPKESLPKEEAPAPKEDKEKKPGILGELSTRISGERESNEEKIKEKIIMELSPKMEKINLRLVKLKAFVDAMKEDKTAEREGNQHINEELGETRSALGSIEGRLSEMEMKLEDVSETLTDLKPQRFAKELQKKEEEIKMHEARLEKLDDMNSTILKRVNQIQIILEKLGNIESIADMTKDISKKLMSIDDKEKKITRLADKIDNMFVEINKRLEDFMFYKAKQDSLDDLSKEMLKSMDELTTKLTRYAEKDDLEILRDTLENKINSAMKEGEMPRVSKQFQQEKSEVESLMGLLDEQFKKGQISKKDYEKAKGANLQKMREMEGGAQKALPIAESKETIIEQMPPVVEEEAETPIPQEPEVQKEESGLAQAAKIAQPPESEPKKETGAKEKKETAPAKPTPVKKAILSNEEEKTVTKDEIAKKIAAEKPFDKKQKMLSDIEYSFRKGIISQKAYETAQKMIMSKKF